MLRILLVGVVALLLFATAGSLPPSPLAAVPLAWAEGAANSTPMLEGPGNPESTPTLTTIGSSVFTYLPLVARDHTLPAPRAPITTSLSHATHKSWACESYDVAHAGAEWGGWRGGSDRGLKATVEYNADYPGYEFWNSCRGYLWASIPAVNERAVRATLRLALCYHTT